MALYFIGDVQGCDEALQRLLTTLAFSPSRDTLFFLGDLVNRGPDSATVLRRLMGFGTSVQCVLGNHDLHLLAVSVGAQRPGRKDTLNDILRAPDRHALLEWLRHQRMAILQEHQNHSYLLVHAGVLPAWSATKTIALAREVEAVLRSTDWPDFLHQLYGNTPNQWDESLSGINRLRVIVNALTRLRFCTVKGEMEFSVIGGAHAALPGYMPWFDVPGRQSSDVRVAFGHWSTLGKTGHDDVIALDSGCVWGGCLSAFKLSDGQHELIQVKCPQSLKPGG